MPQLSLHSPVGDLTISEEDGAIVALYWGWGAIQQPTSPLTEAFRQLHAYFDLALITFDLPLAPAGTDHQRRVWRAMQAIPYGQTRTYGSVAQSIGSAAQPVGTACGRNPIPIIIPCHRVVGAANLGGYSGQGGIDTKSALLRLEGATL